MRKKIFIAAFFAILIIPSLLTFILGPSDALSNEIRSSAPSMNIYFLEDACDYISDHFALRPQLISCWNRINSGLFKSSMNDKVIVGKDDYLFYGDDLDDYTGKHLSEEELESIAVKLKEFQRSVEDGGGEFIFTIAPNKSTLYKDFMPDKFAENLSQSNANKLIPYLEKHEVSYISLFDLEIPYYRTDSHWTAKGAAVAADKLLGTNFASGKFVESGTYKGDLYNMLYPSFEGCESEVKYIDELIFEELDDTNNGNAMYFSCRGAGNKDILVYRDSFGISLYPFLASASKNSTFSRSMSFDEDECLGADIVIIEIAERNLDYLI